MSLERANDAYQRLLRSASKFLSPSLRTFFLARATDDFHCFSKNYNGDESIAEQYVRSQNASADALERTSAIYNAYRDSSSTL